MILPSVSGCSSPDFHFLIFRATSHSVLHQPDVVAPGHIAYPVIVRLYFLSNYKFVVLEVPKLDFPVNPSADEPFRRERELFYVFLAKHYRLGRRAPADRVDASVVCRHGLVGPRVVRLPLDQVEEAVG